MQKFLLTLFIAVICIACSGKDSSSPVDNLNPGPFSFTELKVDSPVIFLHRSTKITAIATGDGLTYEWKASEGTLFGSGRVVEFSICHSTKTKIFCTVKDIHNNTKSLETVVFSKDSTDSIPVVL